GSRLLADAVRAGLVDLRRREHDLPVRRTVGDRGVERVVLVRVLRELAELDVERDRPRIALRDVLDRLRVPRARVGPLLVGEVAERPVVDADDDDVLRSGLPAADPEASVDGLALEGVEEAEPVGDQRDARHADADEQEEGVAEALLAARPHRQRIAAAAESFKLGASGYVTP